MAETILIIAAISNLHMIESTDYSHWALGILLYMIPNIHHTSARQVEGEDPLFNSLTFCSLCSLNTEEGGLGKTSQRGWSVVVDNESKTFVRSVAWRKCAVQ